MNSMADVSNLALKDSEPEMVNANKSNVDQASTILAHNASHASPNPLSSIASTPVDTD